MWYQIIISILYLSLWISHFIYLFITLYFNFSFLFIYFLTLFFSFLFFISFQISILLSIYTSNFTLYIFISTSFCLFCFMSISASLFALLLSIFLSHRYQNPRPLIPTRSTRIWQQWVETRPIKRKHRRKVGQCVATVVCLCDPESSRLCDPLLTSFLTFWTLLDIFFSPLWILWNFSFIILFIYLFIFTLLGFLNTFFYGILFLLFLVSF